ncbi:S8 family peptidase [Mycoplasma crocodyli]|uniref:Peptidase S8/S53 domain-containing protein n=1 Tax=Mycoplasma crocodyli (strain ATCC 51981 / MP145) TaxID=512564 RepID=D5E6A6_MYCCM|nr:S8 family peptidase [Mycoplasma crocodyli]ADE19986.1 hypothetical protein MCRO_0698 [Mycoplasma crocodyli MP145]
MNKKYNSLIVINNSFKREERKFNFEKMLPNNSYLKTERLEIILNNLINVVNYWKTVPINVDPIITVYYNKTTSKSNLISGLFNISNDNIVGSFYQYSELKHAYVYTIPIEKIYCAIDELNKIIDFFKKADITVINNEVLNKIYGKKTKSSSILKPKFKKIIIDVFYIDLIEIKTSVDLDNKINKIITFYNTKRDTKKILNDLGVDLSKIKFLRRDHKTFLAYEDELKLILEKVPFLIGLESQALSDFDELSNSISYNKLNIKIDDPKNEPTIGLLDDDCSNNSYFSKWVDVHNLNNSSSSNQSDHSLVVSSILVDGHRLNPNLNDGCGNFRVRHFSIKPDNSSFNNIDLFNRIRDIVSENRDIKVWNLSFGTSYETSNNSISLGGFEIDKIQIEFDVIFVISGTNKNNLNQEIRIGSPADSINSLVVNSVDKNNRPTSYSRCGKVLHFFTKPDVSYYGGTVDDQQQVVRNGSFDYSFGTSIAAPWISRKVAYLIHTMNFSKEEAKALIIDSAVKWNKLDYETSKYMGHGVVPISINDVIFSKEDEVKIITSGISSSYKTYIDDILIPDIEEKYPYKIKAVMSYFPECSRNMGVDYTNTELNIKFGRLSEPDKIKDISHDPQNSDDDIPLNEKDARMFFSKWENVKVIGEFKERVLPKKTYKAKKWGLQIIKNNRFSKKYDIRFGIVITFKSLTDKIRFDAFFKSLKFLLNAKTIEYEAINEFNLKLEEKINL